VDVIHVAISVVIYTRFTVRLCLICPELVANVLMVDVSAVIEDGDYDWLDRLAIAPRERAGNIINPPEVTGTIRTIVGGLVVY
jgi:hypothetical protein